MKQEVYQVNRTVKSVAALEAVRKIRLSLIILLLVEFFVRFFYRYAVTSLVYLIWMTAGPFLVEQLIKIDRTKEQFNVLPILCKRYRYSYKELKAQIIACIVCNLFFLVQLYGNLQSSITESFIIYTPVFYIFVTIMGFLGMYLYSKKKIGNVLESNQL